MSEAAIDPRTPVLVGAAPAMQRFDDPADALTPAALMAEALRRAEADAGAGTGTKGLLAAADAVFAPRGFLAYPDPAGLVARTVGATRARSLLAEIGVLQTTLFGEACRRIAAGEAEVILVCGGEAKYRDLRGQITGAPAPIEEEDLEPDETLTPASEIMSRAEIAAGLAQPVAQYAVMESALRAAEGQSLAAHRRDVAALWSEMSRVAADNPDAWIREPIAPEALEGPSEGNPMLALPYTKRHNSQWNVDQAAGLIFCSAAAAERLGVPRSRWLFPLAVADNNHMVSLSERRALHRSPGFRLAADVAFSHCRRSPRDVTRAELYSCFPVAVRIQQREIDLPAELPASVTGGMTFAGGPLNNFVLQALARMAKLLRDEPGGLGLVTAVSGLLTKQGVSLWSSAPPSEPFAFLDVRDATRGAIETVEVVPEASGPARVAGYTVLYQQGAPYHAALVCDLPDGRRSIATSQSPAHLETLCREEACGRDVALEGGKLVD